MSKPLRILDNTALNAFRMCRWEYYASMEEDRRSDATTPALWYGTVMHKLLEVFYKTNDPLLAEAVGRKLYTGKEPVKSDYRTLGRAIVVFHDYVEEYGNPQTKHESTIGWPDAPAVELSTSVRFPLTGVDYAVRMDRLIRVGDDELVEDHKTTSSFGKTFFDEFVMSPQMMGYTRVGSLLLNRPLAGARINAIVTRKNDHEFHRRIVKYTPERLNDWERTVALHQEEIIQRRASGIWPKDYNCSRKYGKCTYFDVCRLPSHLQERALATEYRRAAWDPLNLHDDDDAEPRST